jgi:hypothetical protein
MLTDRDLTLEKSPNLLAERASIVRKTDEWIAVIAEPGHLKQTGS